MIRSCFVCFVFVLFVCFLLRFFSFFFFDLLYAKEHETLNYDERTALGHSDSELGPAAMKRIETD